jgi:hypothetical protein
VIKVRFISQNEIETEGRRFERVTSKRNHKRYLTALRKTTSTVFLNHGKNDGTSVYVRKETILKEMAAIIKLSQHFIFDQVWELFDSTSYMGCKACVLLIGVHFLECSE